MKFFKPLMLMLLVSACTQAVASAHNGLGLAYLYGYRGFAGYGTRAYGPPPPYFSMHPPVYYGKRYSRPYGVSPFAAWPQLQANPAYAPAIATPQTQIIANPHFQGCTAPNSGCQGPAVETYPAAVGGVVKNLAPKPVEFDNPYFKPSVQYTAKEKQERR